MIAAPVETDTESVGDAHDEPAATVFCNTKLERVPTPAMSPAPLKLTVWAPAEIASAGEELVTSTLTTLACRFPVGDEPILHKILASERMITF